MLYEHLDETYGVWTLVFGFTSPYLDMVEDHQVGSVTEAPVKSVRLLS